MIPYAILGGKIYSADEKVTDIRVLELMADGFTFRMPRDYKIQHGEFTYAEMTFFDWKTKTYNSVGLNLAAEGNGCEPYGCNEFYDEYMIKTVDDRYAVLSANLSKDYLKYIDCKLNLDDAELSAEMAGYPAVIEEAYAEDYEAQVVYTAEAIMHNHDAIEGMRRIADSDACEMCYSIENRELVDMYLSMHVGEFVVSVFKKKHLENHPFSFTKINRIYIGNEYCCNMLPDADTLIRVAGKAADEGMSVTAAIPPVPAGKYKDICKYIDKCISYVSEVCVNDVGMLSYVREHYPAVRVIKGILLDKYRRDPRMKYAQDLVCENSGVIYYPYYQTNTGTFCPLHAAVKNGSRGNQERVRACNGECLEKALVYPKGLNVIGRYNSLFGVYIEGIDSKPRRVVINL